jgi:predicted component of type VI protein secretion system
MREITAWRANELFAVVEQSVQRSPQVSGIIPARGKSSAAHRVAALGQASKRSEAILCLRSQGRFSAVIGRLAHRTSVRSARQLTGLIFDCAEPRSVRERGVCSLYKPSMAAARIARINTR